MTRLILMMAALWGSHGFSQFRVVHFNIKELDAVKLLDKDEQVTQSVAILDELQGDFLSINELQYEMPGIPSPRVKTHGKNAAILAGLLRKDYKFTSFHEANTGRDAKAMPSSKSYLVPEHKDFGRWRAKVADHNNFGVFPGQYSTAGLYNHKKLREFVIADLQWQMFHPKRDLSPFKNGLGKALPKTLELFDKNFTDLTLEINGKPVHFILLHTIPAFGFGNKQSPNFARNADQLRFLEWYLTGSTDIPVPVEELKALGISPLKKGSRFVAMGDWNTDVKANNEGSAVLRRLFSKTNNVLSQKHSTYVGSDFSLGGFKGTLDYIVTSTNIRVKDQGIEFADPMRKELGCFSKKGWAVRLLSHV